MMPELPEVETVRRIIERAAVGKRVVGALLKGVDRRAKWLTLRFDRDPQAILHLRMTGQIATVAPDGKRAVAGHPVPAYDATLPAKTTHLTLEFDDGTLVYLQD